MHITRLDLKDVRQFKHASFQFHQGFNLLVGKNGLGKTTVLRSILAAAASRKNYPRGNIGFSMDDINLSSDELQVTASLTDRHRKALSLVYRRDISGRIRRTGNRSPVSLIYYPSNESLPDSLKQKKAKKSVHSPAHDAGELEDFLYRTQEETNLDIPPEEQFGRSREIREFVANAIAKLSPKFTNFGWRFQAYSCVFRGSKEDREVNPAHRGLRRQLESILLRHFLQNPEILAEIDARALHVDSDGIVLGSRSPGHTVSPPFRKLLEAAGVSVAPKDLNALENNVIKVRLTPRIFVGDDKNRLSLSQLSDGEMRIFSLFVDIARILSLHSTKPIADTQAIVLIDEIDVHLHPKWQRSIVSNLEDLFPSCQFIASTHSPFVIQSVERSKIQKATIAGGIEVAMSDSNSIEDIIEEIQEIAVPQRGKRAEELHEAAKTYFSLLRERSSDDQELHAAESEYRKASEPFTTNPALNALFQIEKKRVE